MQGYKSGYVGIIGKPNVGKSTLLNYFLNQKLAIVSEKPQTTRTRILGILTQKDYQIIFIDTPGVHQPQDQLHAYMQSQITETVADVDLLLFLVAADESLVTEDQLALKLIESKKVPTLLVINKIDLNPVQAESLHHTLFQSGLFVDAVYISALHGTGCSELLQKIVAFLPEGPQYYPEDMLTDRTERFFISELIREQVYRLTHQEIPYSVAVVTEEVKERNDALTYVKAVIYVERDSQKKILVGTNGKKLKEIGQAARKEVELFLQKKVYLDLWVKVKKNWRKDATAVKLMNG
ncbi:MAG: GTPase Era [bacterium]|nr:GTPase Era [bacterium]